MPKHPPLLPDFETALTEIERIVATMESGQMPLNEAISAYQRGVTLLRHCQLTLSTAETQIKVLEQGSLRELGSSVNTESAPHDQGGGE